MAFGEALLLAVSLCADCFACTLCAGVTLAPGPGDTVSAAKEKRRRAWELLWIALAFASVHTIFLLAGWGFGSMLVGFVERISQWIGFLLLLYVGGGMLLEGIRALRGHCDLDHRRLDGFRNVLFSAVATSIDALGVGASQSMLEAGRPFASIAGLAVTLFVVTVLVVLSGLLGGRVIGRQFGHWAEVAGGLVLIGIGVSFLF